MTPGCLLRWARGHQRSTGCATRSTANCSIEPATDTYPVHRLLLGSGVVIVEGLDLSAVLPGRYQLVCLPLRIAQGDGAPARAVLIAKDEPAP